MLLITWKRLLLRLAAMLSLLGAVPAPQMAPERTVQDHVLSSAHDPKLRVILPASAHYVGADRWVLYRMADCELHAFVDADSQKNVQRLYWVQFEQHLPSRPELHHTYHSPKHANIGGMDFYIDSWVRGTNEPSRAGSDLQHIVDLIRAKGYRIPGGMMYVRFVHLLDEQKRKELMIIYAEDVAASGRSTSDLQRGGTSYHQWPSVRAKLVDRARTMFTLEP